MTADTPPARPLALRWRCLLIVVFLLHFSTAVVEAPIAANLRRISCTYVQKGEPAFDSTACGTEEVNDRFEYDSMISHILHTIGALVAAYQATSIDKGRLVPFSIWAFVWMLHQVIQPDLPYIGLCWATDVVIGGSKLMVELAVLATMTDLSTNHNRSINIAQVTGFSILGYQVGQLLTRPTNWLSGTSARLLCASGVLTAIFVGYKFVQDNLSQQVEGQPKDAQPRTKNRVAEEIQKVRYTASLLLVASFSLPLFTSSFAYLNSYLSHNFVPPAQLETYPIKWWTMWLVSIALLVVIIFDYIAMSAWQRLHKRRDWGVAFVSAIAFFGGSIFFLATDSQLDLWVGAFFAAFGAGVVTHSLGMVVLLAGPTVRANCAGNLFAMIRMLQCVLTLGIMPPMATDARLHKTSKKPFIAIFVLSLLLLIVIVITGSKLPFDEEPSPQVDVADNTPAQNDAQSDIEMQPMPSLQRPEHPRTPPPVYSFGRA
ncbi:hypothetical protein C8034_v006488 [Colletotrichum sidae]|uniref:Uncharacterized protein n=1 Tax=Colletotrichum sidae TaxID=1347389 RepID=A0A4V3I4H5_9PEZI|nr:hypothetical protein C8034_v006488 [Colletotrichum sidae]